MRVFGTEVYERGDLRKKYEMISLLVKDFV